jgi:hypothetical protein
VASVPCWYRTTRAGRRRRPCGPSSAVLPDRLELAVAVDEVLDRVMGIEQCLRQDPVGYRKIGDATVLFARHMDLSRIGGRREGSRNAVARYFKPRRENPSTIFLRLSMAASTAAPRRSYDAGPSGVRKPCRIRLAHTRSACINRAAGSCAQAAGLLALLPGSMIDPACHTNKRVGVISGVGQHGANHVITIPSRSGHSGGSVLHGRHHRRQARST